MPFFSLRRALQGWGWEVEELGFGRDAFGRDLLEG